MINLEYNLPLYVNFVDFKAAFDSIKSLIGSSSERHSAIMDYLVNTSGFCKHSSTTLSALSVIMVNSLPGLMSVLVLGRGLGDIQGVFKPGCSTC